MRKVKWMEKKMNTLSFFELKFRVLIPSLSLSLSLSPVFLISWFKYKFDSHFRCRIHFIHSMNLFEANGHYFLHHRVMYEVLINKTKRIQTGIRAIKNTQTEKDRHAHTTYNYASYAYKFVRFNELKIEMSVACIRQTHRKTCTILHTIVLQCLAVCFFNTV